jgi:hypothetical protein
VSDKTAYLIYCEKDAVFANAVKNVTAENLIYLQTEAISHAETSSPDLDNLLALLNQPKQNASVLINIAHIVLLILSPEALSDEKFIFCYNYLLQSNKQVILIITKNGLVTEVPDNFYPVDFSKENKAAYALLLKYIKMLPDTTADQGGLTGFQDFTKQNNSGNFNPDLLGDFSGNSKKPELFNTDNTQTSGGTEQGGGSGDILQTLLGKVSNTLVENTGNPAGYGNIMDLIKGLFDNNQTPAATVSSSPAVIKGKILYDIPDTMQLEKQEKCVIRIGKDEVTVKSGNVFSATVVTDDIKLSGLMKVELIDIANNPNFTIKTISTPIQEVDDSEFTEWLFYVTPVNAGLFSLIIKVSAIKNEAGREKIKDIVFEKNISINTGKADSSFAAMSFAASFSAAIKPVPEKQLRDIANEPAAKYMESPDVFISYAHEDRRYFEIFEKNLKSQSGWNIWTDRNIQIGADWFDQIQQSMTVCNIAFLLISAGFFSSAFIKEHEYRKLKKIKENNPAVIIIPVLLRDTDINRWEDLTAIQFFPAHHYEYGVVSDSNSLLPFAMLCEFDKSGLLIPNAFIDTYFKNLVQKVQNDWLRNKLPVAL